MEPYPTFASADFRRCAGRGDGREKASGGFEQSSTRGIRCGEIYSRFRDHGHGMSVLRKQDAGGWKPVSLIEDDGFGSCERPGHGSVDGAHQLPQGNGLPAGTGKKADGPASRSGGS